MCATNYEYKVVTRVILRLICLLMSQNESQVGDWL